MNYDELLFLHSGNFFSRDGKEPGKMTFHPSGFPQGPHPGAYKASLEAAAQAHGPRGLTARLSRRGA